MSVSICERCGVGFQRVSSMGPEPKFCSHTCRQRAYEARRDESTKAALAIAKEALTYSLNLLRELAAGICSTDTIGMDHAKKITRDALARIAELEDA